MTSRHGLVLSGRIRLCPGRYGHPCRGRAEAARLIVPIAEILADPPREGEIVLSGMISALERRVNKQGEPWAICTIEDLDASIEVLFFPKSYSVLAADLVEDAAVAVRAG